MDLSSLLRDLFTISDLKLNLTLSRNQVLGRLMDGPNYRTSHDALNQKSWWSDTRTGHDRYGSFGLGAQYAQMCRCS